MIPKIIHQIWPGNDPCPTFLSESIIKLHPTWEYKLWTPDNFPPFYNQELYNATPLYNMKSDIARLEILYQYGGFYADLDWICTKPLDAFLNYQYVLAREFEKGKLIANFIIGCYAEWSFLYDAIEFIKSNTHKARQATRPGQTPALTGSGMLKKLAKNLTILPSHLFNPYDHIHEIKRMTREEALHIPVPATSYGYHLYCHYTKQQK